MYNKNMKKPVFFLLFIAYFLLPASASAQSIDLLWQGQTYIPPFYEGRALWSKQARIIMTAVVSGLGDPNSLIYRWSKDGSVLGSVSGIGKKSLTFSDNVFSDPITITVEVIGSNNATLAENTVSVEPREYAPMIYENNPLYGFMFHREVGTGFMMDGQEATFTAFPFFANAAAKTAPSLSYKWSTNSGGSEYQNTVTYRAPEDGAGIAKISLTLKDASDIIPAVNRSFLIKFGDEK